MLFLLALVQLAQAPASFGDYIYTLPQGWTAMPQGAGAGQPIGCLCATSV